ncbi:hypothetical protein M8J77_014947 [Diaphorina citri]|nr:hypothetical protein M8J77_014947 [Diaphorina citri]
MRIAALQSLLAAVSLAVVLLPVTQAIIKGRSYSSSRYNRDDHGELGYQKDRPYEEGGVSLMKPNHYKAMSKEGYYSQEIDLLKEEGGDEKRDVSCCPSVEEKVEPIGGTKRDNTYVELYRDGNNTQVFFELICRGDVEGQPCRFTDSRLHNISRCVQTYSWTYAIVREDKTQHFRHQGHKGSSPEGYHFPNSHLEGWVLDYIRVKSGCSCVIDPKKLRKRGKASKSRPGKKQAHLRNKVFQEPSSHYDEPDGDPGRYSDGLSENNT